MSEWLVLGQALGRVLLVRAALDRFDDLGPSLCIGTRLSIALPVESFQLYLLWEISAEVGSIDDEVLDQTRCSESDDCPVDMTLDSGSCSLPPVAHILASSWVDEVIFGSKVLVAARDGNSSVLGCCEIKDGILVVWEDRHGMAKETEPGNASIRVHVQSDMCVLLLGRAV